MKNYVIAHFDDIEAVECPCGFAKRAFAVPDNSSATVHIVDIRQDSQVHYHKDHTEIVSNFPVEQITVVDPIPGYAPADSRHRKLVSTK